jgi:hypothetical protein
MTQRARGKPGGVYRLLDLIDEVMHAIAPILAIVFRYTLQFTDYMSVADGMTGDIPEIG